jgi:hypothetical protein
MKKTGRFQSLMSSAAPATAMLLLSALIVIFAGASGGAWGADPGGSADPRVAWLKEKACLSGPSTLPMMISPILCLS